MTRCRVSMLALFHAAFLFTLFVQVATAEEAAISRVFSEQTPLDDARLKPPRNLQDAYHPWVPPSNRQSWDKTAREIREQVLVAAGLWPMPEKTPLNPVIHGSIDRGDYTVEKVYFASRPGHYVTGNLYRPKNLEGIVPGILCPHGHWPNGRFHDAGVEAAQKEVENGAESFEAGAHYPLQARFAQLARMGCIVFHYDMLGYADSKPLEHRTGMDDGRSLLWQNNKLGLQTWNSIRALDFLLTLPHVDPNRLAVTGSSGGGTQTMLLGAVDDRVAVTFPAVMVSTGMQGGCICENAPYLRVGLNNVAFAAAFAPKPQKMSGADDWTIEIETKGLPELKQVYSLYGMANLVDARALPQFKHNYNEPSRELMYDWFNEHLGLDLPTPVKQIDFEPIPPAELAVFDAEYPLPADALGDAELQDSMIAESRKQFEQLVETAKTNLTEYKRVIGTAARVMLGEFPNADSIQTETTNEQRIGDVQLLKGWTRRETGAVTPWLVLIPPNANGTAALWVNGRGKAHLLTDAGEPTKPVRKLLDAGIAVASLDMFGTGEFPDSSLEDRMKQRSETYPGFLFCYNRPLLAEQVEDVTAVIARLAVHPDFKTVQLIGTEGAGPAVLLARAMTPEGLVDRTIVDLDGASFEKVTEPTDPLLLPAALKYGGLGGLAALALPGNLYITGVDADHLDEFRPLALLADQKYVKISTDPIDMTSLSDLLQK